MVQTDTQLRGLRIIPINLVLFLQSTPGESRAVILTAPTIVYPQQATIVQQDGRHLDQNRYVFNTYKFHKSFFLPLALKSPM